MTRQFNESDPSTTSLVSGASSNPTIQPLQSFLKRGLIVGGVGFVVELLVKNLLGYFEASPQTAFQAGSGVRCVASGVLLLLCATLVSKSTNLTYLFVWGLAVSAAKLIVGAAMTAMILRSVAKPEVSSALGFLNGGLDAFEFALLSAVFALQYFQPVKSNKLMMAGICGAVVEFTCIHITANALIPVFIDARLDGVAMLSGVEFFFHFSIASFLLWYAVWQQNEAVASEKESRKEMP